MRTQSVLLAGLLVMLAAPVQAQGTSAIVTAENSSEAAIDELADHLVNEADVISIASANFDAEFNREFAKGGTEFEAKFPGVRQVAATAGKQETLRIMREAYPELRETARAILKADLTPEEIAEANAFYATPTGQKLARAVVNGARGRDAATIAGSAQLAAAQATGPEDSATLVEFSRSKVYPKIQPLGFKLQQASIDWAKRLIEQSSPRVQQAVQQAILIHIMSLQRGGGK